MTVAQSFQCKKVLVTRPQHQADNMVRMITAAGGVAIRFPLIAIEANPDQQHIIGILTRLDNYDQAIFISPNAADYALVAIDSCNKRPQLLKQKVWAIGDATAKALHSGSIKDVLKPDKGCNSEALLNMPDMQSGFLSGSNLDAPVPSNIIIFRGGEGRTLLEDTLRARGANVTCADIYIRKKPEVSTEQLGWLEHGIDVIMISSGEALLNLLSMIPENRRALLNDVVLLLGSERIFNNEKARLSNICCIIAENPGDEAMMTALTRFFREQLTGHE